MRIFGENQATLEESSGAVVVMPTCRRSQMDPETSADHAHEARYKSLLDDFFRNNRDNENFNKLANRIELFSSDVVYQLEVMRSAVERRNLQTVDVIAKKLAARCEDIGANRMMQLCYQLHISARVGHDKELGSLLEKLASEFAHLKEKLLVSL